jgi:predicted phosphodiesterase
MASDNPPVVRTRFLVISDTHGFRYLPDAKPVEPIDVVIHCGDITGSSQLAEFQAAIQLLHQIPAPLKLIIPGNHDFTLDEPTYCHLLHKSRKRRSFPDMLRSHGQLGDARRLFEEAAKHNTSESTVLYLDEGART